MTEAWLFADTVSGAKASAHVYSLVQTARANELDPCAYLCSLFSELPAAQMTHIGDFSFFSAGSDFLAVSFSSVCTS